MNTIGSYKLGYKKFYWPYLEFQRIPIKCPCNEGYELVAGKGCVDIDECIGKPCPETKSCRNKNGGYDCVCAPGYIKNQVYYLSDFKLQLNIYSIEVS